MLPFKIIRNKDGQIVHIETSLTGYELLSMPKLNKGCAFTEDERKIFKLEGLLPHQVETLEQQVARMYEQYLEHRTNLAKNIYLNVLHDYNETLFYKLVSQYLEEMLPIIYTPTVGEAVERFSLEHRKSRGLYISYLERDHIDKILENRVPDEVDLIVVTDGEAVLGIGDQGIGGVNIAVAKLMVYTLCAGINPNRVLPIQLDVGTNNQHLLSDPMYLGWRHERIQKEPYYDFIDKFVQSVKRKFPHIFLHWEDLGRDNARFILEKYKTSLCTFNGDMQGTGAVGLATVLAACRASKIKLAKHRIVIFGAGTAGVGIADQICDAMIRMGLSKAEAAAHIWLIDKSGLLLDSLPLAPFQRPYARPHEEVSKWNLTNPDFIGLSDVVKNVKPTILIGSSTVAGAFTEEIVRIMKSYQDRPIIMPLSNPTIKSEAKPEDLLKWTDCKAIIATGSPFPDVLMGEKRIRIAQSNNALAFPGIGLGAMAVKAKQFTDDMLWAATKAISESSPLRNQLADSANDCLEASLLPKLSEAKSVSQHVAMAVAQEACRSGVAENDIDINQAIHKITWNPNYYPYKKI